ncbi:hypothetical protein [Ahrensia marina]|nr:hypothetical protein [Ahrensia marina]
MQTTMKSEGNDSEAARLDQAASQIDMVAEYLWDEEIILPSPY